MKTNSVVAIGKEIFYTAGRNVNECNHYDNQYGFELRFLKKLKIELCPNYSTPKNIMYSRTLGQHTTKILCIFVCIHVSCCSILITKK